MNNQTALTLPDHQAAAQHAKIAADQVGAVRQAAATLVVESEEQYTYVGTCLQEIVRRKKEVERVLKEFTAPLKQHVKTIEGYFKPAIADYKETEEHLRRAMSSYKTREMQARQARLREAQKQATTGQPQAFHTAMVAAQNPGAQAQGISTRTVYQFEVTDMNAVPREWLMIDERKVREALKATQGKVVIPGVRVWAEAGLTVRTS